MSLILFSAIPHEIGVWYNWFELEIKSDLCTQIYYSIGCISTSTKQNLGHRAQCIVPLRHFAQGGYQTRMPSSSSCLICSSVMPRRLLKMYSVSAPKGGAGRWM